MGAVDIASSALEEITLTGRLDPKRNKAIFKMIGEGGKFTPNQKMMARAAGLHSSDVAIRQLAIRTLSDQIESEHVNGPTHWELMPPYPHGGMYYFARAGVLAAWEKNRHNPEISHLGMQTAIIMGQEFRLAGLIAQPQLIDCCKGLPGMRAPHGAYMGRPDLSTLWIEISQHHGIDVPHRGPSGRVRKLKWDFNDSDPLSDGAAWWMRKILSGGLGPILLQGPLSLTAPLPKKLRTSLTIKRWKNRTLAFLGDPGTEEGRREFIITGSAAAKRLGGQELPVVWIEVVDTGSGPIPEVRAGTDWDTPLPDISGDHQTWFIPGAE